MAADPLTSATVNDLLNFDSTDDEDPFNDKPTQSPRGTSKRKADDLDDALGLKSEVKIKKQRKPIAKLDEARLLSAPGIPKLRADARMSNFLTKKLRIKGKGHEFSDTARLLNYYQLWLDDLYPRAKFADGLQLVEKAGHSRRMQVLRKEWIDEGKPGYIREREAKKKAEKEERERERETDEMYAGEETMMSGANNEPRNEGYAVGDNSLFIPDLRTKSSAEEDDSGLPEDDELDALLAEQDTRTTARPTSAPKRIIEDDSEGEDDLDALLAEQENRHKASPPNGTVRAAKSKSSFFYEDDDEDMDGLDALLAEQENPSKPTHAPAQRRMLPSPEEDEFAIDKDDELEALLAEQEAREVFEKQVLLPPSISVLAPTSHMDEDAAEAEGDGADMFSSSPVRGTGSTNMLPGEEADSARAGVKATDPHQRDEDVIQGDKEEESHGQDADDMFSSSPM